MFPWEGLYHGYLRMSAKYGKTSRELVLSSLKDLKENLDLLETELLGDAEKLI